MEELLKFLIRMVIYKGDVINNLYVTHINVILRNTKINEGYEA